MEEEDFEGYVKQFCPGLRYPYEVAYDDGDEEWGWFSTTQFHTDEVSRKYSWLTDQDEAVAKAAAKALLHLEGPTATSAKPAPASISAVVASSTASAAAVGSVAPTLTGTVGSIAFRKDQLRAARDVLSNKALGQAPSASVIRSTGLVAPAGSTSSPAALPNPVLTSDSQRGSTVRVAQSVAPELPENHALMAASSSEAAAMQPASEPAQSPAKGKAALKEANAPSQISGPAAAKLQLTAGAQPPTRKRKSNQLQHGNSGPAEASLAGADKVDAALPAGVARSHLGDFIAETDGSQPDVTSTTSGDQGVHTAQQKEANKLISENTAKQKAAAEKRVKHANDPQFSAITKEHKRKRLRKMSERDACDPQMKAAEEVEVCISSQQPCCMCIAGPGLFCCACVPLLHAWGSRCFGLLWDGPHVAKLAEVFCCLCLHLALRLTLHSKEICKPSATNVWSCFYCN